MLVVAGELGADAVRREQLSSPPRVLAEHEVRLRELGEHAQRHIPEIADRRRADRERHRLAGRVESLEGDQRRADHPGLLAERRGDDADEVSAGR